MGHLEKLIDQNGNPEINGSYDLANDLNLIREAISRIARSANNKANIYAQRTNEDSSLNRAIQIYHLRRRREVVLGEFFADPAWDILLDMFIAQRSDKTVSVSAACVGAAVPPTTALRAIGLLVAAGMIQRETDPHDGRRINVSLTPGAVEKMEALLV